MYLEKLEIQGFKSFANKNTLVFPGMLSKNKRGITSIVGPNGSGKSNIADAVRWALGEQSMKTLRGKKNEDIIFSGSDKKGKFSMAEVSLFLNNDDRKAAIDYSQIILTRRIYRDGESEYLINGSRVRLSDVQILLAKSNFGQKTYSVIGQGLVEGFLNTTLSERKEFFDEATGVKQFQIKRDDSLNKLLRGYENLNQASMLAAEIEPRLKNLTRQMNKLKKRDEIEAELKNAQLEYYGKLWHELSEKFNSNNKQLLEIEKIKAEKSKKHEQLNRELAQIEKQNFENNELSESRKELDSLQIQKEILNKQAARLEAALEIKLETNGQFDLSWLAGKKEEIRQEIKNNEEESQRLESHIKQEQKILSDMEAEKNAISEKIDGINRQVLKFSDAGAGMGKIGAELKELAACAREAQNAGDLEDIKKIIKKMERKIMLLMEISEKNGENGLEESQKKLMESARDKETVMNKINESSFRVSARSERLRIIKERKNGLKNELADIENRLKQSKIFVDADGNKKERERIKKQSAELDEKIRAAKEKLDSFNAKADEQKIKIFSLQKNLHALQNEINCFDNNLNELKINSARHETRLEDLETEIRNNRCDLKEIKSGKISAVIDGSDALEKINFLKKQMEQIGGIDPETETEHAEAKKRFDYLESQINDLDGTIGSLEKIIKELDLIIKEKFDKEFKNISEKFEEYFKILFNGGTAKIVKVLAEESHENSEPESEKNEENKSEKNLKRIKYLQKHNATGLAGIEILATPPGKKIKSISMLSGGEKALTAIGLIGAIISCNPAPFVVLDEVDASLDEANSERLAKILDDLSHKTQFIIITHNRASMRRAQILYGVTMEESGVSKLLSIKLDQSAGAEKR